MEEKKQAAWCRGLSPGWSQELAQRPLRPVTLLEQECRQESRLRGRPCESRTPTVRPCSSITQAESVGRAVCFTHPRSGFSLVFQKMALATAVCSTWEGTFFLIKETFNFLGVGVEQIHVCSYQNYHLECQLGTAGAKQRPQETISRR